MRTATVGYAMLGFALAGFAFGFIVGWIFGVFA